MSTNESEFMSRFRGYFRGCLRWEELDALWARLRTDADGWYLYAVGEDPPVESLDPVRFSEMLAELDALLRREHDESYCGIVYVDNPEQPTLVKVYDPNNLGSVCGPGFGPPPLPGWVISRLPPSRLETSAPPENRRRWWRKLFG